MLNQYPINSCFSKKDNVEIGETQHVENLSIINNKIILSKDDLELSNASLYACSLYGDVAVNKATISNNALQINNAKNVRVGSIHNFDAFSFILPNNLSDGDTILTLTNQGINNVIVDANKLTISNYDHHTSTLTVNLIDSMVLVTFF
ncbi:MAG: hypothetical protein LBC22_00075 [Endomicrobium sp.]|nr:hypothetical protein [Endomicrobium sp.]